MSPRINSQGPLSDLPRLHVADESNMAAEMAELETRGWRSVVILEMPGQKSELKNSLKTLSYHFDFYVGEKYMECLLVDFSDYNR